MHNYGGPCELYTLLHALNIVFSTTKYNVMHVMFSNLYKATCVYMYRCMNICVRTCMYMDVKATLVHGLQTGKTRATHEFKSSHHSLICNIISGHR